MKRSRRSPAAALLLLLAAVALVAFPVSAADPRGGHGSAAAPAEPTLVGHGPRDRRVVALTFDDGYAPWNVRRILRVLDSEGVTATFFVNGIYLQRDPALWRAVGRTQHAIGNHTYMHEDATRMTPAELIADLRRNQRVVEAATGRSMAPIFRPPYGRRNAATDAAAAAAGFPAIVLWDASAADATRHPGAAASVRAATRGRPGSIVLMHAGPSLTPRILRDVIRSYRDRGFGFVTVPALLGLPEAAAPVGTVAPADARCAAGNRSLECIPDDGVLPAPPGDDEAANGGQGEEPGAGTIPAGPAPRRTPVPDQPPARASAWVRGPDAQAVVASVTVGLLILLIVAGALLGGRRPPRPGRRERRRSSE